MTICTILFRLLRKKRTFALLFVLFVTVLFVNNHWLGRLMYPIHYEEEIRYSAEFYEIDPLLIAAIIRVESNFRPDLVSSKQAMGLMQLMPDTASWIVEQSKLSGELSGEIKDHLMREDVNIHLGAWYLRYLYDLFTSHTEDKPDISQMAVVIAAYNAGPGNVEQWLKQNQWDGSLTNAKLIPFGETRHYVSRVTYYYKKYVQVYGEDWSQ